MIERRQVTLLPSALILETFGVNMETMKGKYRLFLVLISLKGSILSNVNSLMQNFSILHLDVNLPPFLLMVVLLKLWIAQIAALLTFIIFTVTSLTKDHNQCPHFNLFYFFCFIIFLCQGQFSKNQIKILSFLNSKLHTKQSGHELALVLVHPVTPLSRY